jgi:hypothetical protein
MPAAVVVVVIKAVQLAQARAVLAAVVQVHLVAQEVQAQLIWAAVAVVAIQILMVVLAVQEL